LTRFGCKSLILKDLQIILQVLTKFNILRIGLTRLRRSGFGAASLPGVQPMGIGGNGMAPKADSGLFSVFDSTAPGGP
jgi:hypothetical protein